MSARIRERMEFALEVTGAVVWDWQIESDEVAFYPPSQTLYDADITAVGEFVEQVHPADRDQVRAALESALDETGEYTTEFRIRRNDETRWIADHGRVQYDDANTPLRMTGVAQDITRRKERERELERLNQFATDVTHDLANPLNALRGWLELASETGDEEHLDRCEEIVERMEELIDDISTFAREGGTAVDREALDVGDIAADCWDTLDTADAELRVLGDCPVCADEVKLRTLLSNVMRNAVEHGGPDVTVTVGRLADEAGFYIEDDGPGIPEAEREKVFERGYSRSATGTGFGLAIVRQIVDVHGWSVSVTEGDAGGARFEITDVEP